MPQVVDVEAGEEAGEDDQADDQDDRGDDQDSTPVADSSPRNACVTPSCALGGGGHGA